VPEAVGNPWLPTFPAHRRNGIQQRSNAVVPVVHTVYYSYEVFLKND
jgi:hypothetical protein